VLIYVSTCRYCFFFPVEVGFWDILRMYRVQWLNAAVGGIYVSKLAEFR